jgi:hypothetical protein
MRRGALGLGILAAAAASLLLPWAPGYDPLAWLVWGREAAALELDTTAGPAWKPLPVLVTTLVAPAGEAAAALWIVLARAGALAAVSASGLLAARLAPAGWRALAAGTAALTLLLADGFVQGAALGYSEGLLVALALLAVERHLAARPGQALALAGAAALLRPETWPFLVLYGCWAWLRRPSLRPLVAGLALAVPALWLGPELWGSGDLLRSSERARVPNPGAPALAERPSLAVLGTVAGLLPPLALAGLAALRRDRVVVALATGALAWVAIVAAMAELGYSGEPRYLLAAAGPVAVLAGAGLARAAAALPGAVPAAAAAAAALAGSLVLAVPEARRSAATLEHAAALHQDLGRAVEEAGGHDRLRACGPPYAGRYRFPAVAWRLRVPISEVALTPSAPGVVLRSRLTATSSPEPDPPAGFALLADGGGWDVLASCEQEAR